MKKIKTSILISVLVSFITIGIVIYITPTEGLWEAIQRIRLGFLAMAFAFHMFGWLVMGIRIKALAKAVNIKVSIKKSIEIVLAGAFAGGITPSYVGGEPVLIYLLGKQNNSSGGKSSVVVLGGRTLDLIFFIGVVLLSLLILGNLFARFIDIKWLLIGIIGISLVLIVFLYYSLYDPDKIKNIISYLGKPVERFKPNLKKKLFEEIDSFHKHLWFLLTKNKRYFGIGFLCTVLFWALEFSIPFILLRGMGVEVNFLQAWIGYVVVVAVTMIPITPGGSGFAEAGATITYSAIADVTFIGIFILLLRLITYYTNILVGGLVSSKVLYDLEYIEEHRD